MAEKAIPVAALKELWIRGFPAEKKKRPLL
ncbi:hypothetical protein COLO4_21815 [Corchorus olitorius]|uniref:Uncharacterized protein n=1 Tax=Corchorus olitorius TaxID=93759 RepID=A0A1R3IQL2_9ROSI|nr:hypothetical protein COLO4_21815 [Corchorus olitorius]